MPTRKGQEKARLALIQDGWGVESINAALIPTRRQKKERAFLSAAPVNPEQFSAIVALHALGWDFEEIKAAIPVSAGAIARVIRAANVKKGVRKCES